MSKIEVGSNMQELLTGKLNGGFKIGELSAIGVNNAEGLSHKSNYLHYLCQRAGVTPPQPKTQIDLEGPVDFDKLIEQIGVKKNGDEEQS